MFNFSQVPIDWLALLPVIVLCFGGIVALTIEMLRPKQNNNPIVAVSLVTLIAAGAAVWAQWYLPDETLLGGLVVRDRFGLAMQLLTIIATFLAVLFSEGYLREKRIPFGEFYPLLLWAASGGLIMSTTHNLLMLFLGLEVLSIALYVLAGFSRSEEKSEESAMKYFLLGAFSTGFLLYGVAMLYGGTGSLDMGTIASAWEAGDASIRGLLLFGTGLLLVGLCFKASFVPFHQWTPDVYQGAPTNVAAFMAAGSKIGVFAALWRFLEGAEPLKQFWIPALGVVAILTMTVGNLAALAQKDIKRVLGYSSIANAGYILVAMLAHFANPRENGFQTLTYYLFAYTLMTVGAFAVVSMVAKEGQEGTRLEALHGMWKRTPLAAGTLVVFMVSLIGIPPTAGFWGKYFIFMDAMRADLVPLAIALAINSVISIAYYLAIAKAVFVDEEGDERPVNAPFNVGLGTACALCAAGVLIAAVLVSPFLTLFGQ